jgi:hypothetical protein
MVSQKWSNKIKSKEIRAIYGWCGSLISEKGWELIRHEKNRTKKVDERVFWKISYSVQ